MPDSNILEITSNPSENERLKLRVENLKVSTASRNEKEGILLTQENPTKEQKQTNRIFNALGEKILDTCNHCLLDQTNQEKYQETAIILLKLFESISKVGEGNIKFHHLSQKEQASGNKVSYFQSSPFFLDNTEISMLINIRPENDFVESKGKKFLKAQARTNIVIYSKNLPSGEASVRIDPPDSRLDNNVVFDITVGRAGQDHASIIDELDLNQKAGHHFPSGIRINDLEGVKISDIHKTVSARLEELTQ